MLDWVDDVAILSTNDGILYGVGRQQHNGAEVGNIYVLVDSNSLGTDDDLSIGVMDGDILDIVI